MRWYVILNSQKQGPFDAVQLRDKLRRGEVSLASIVLKEGSPARVKLSDVVEVVGGQNFAAEGADQFALGKNDGKTVVAGTNRVEKRVAPSFEQDNVHTQIAPSQQRQVAPVEQRQMAMARTASTPALATRPEPMMLQHSDQLPEHACPLSDMHPPLQPVSPPALKGLKKPPPDPLKRTSNKTPQGSGNASAAKQAATDKMGEGPPSHQMPQVASEGVLKPNRKEVHWQRDRLNTTSRGGKQNVSEAAFRTRQSKNQKEGNNHTALLLGIVFVLGVLLLLVSFNAINRSKKVEETHNNEMAKIAALAQRNALEKSAAAKKPQVQDFSDSGSAMQITASPKAASKAEQKKARQKAKIESKKQKQQLKLQQQQEKSRLAQNAQKAQRAQEKNRQAQAKLQAENNQQAAKPKTPKKATGGSSGNGALSSAAQLAANTFKVANVGPIAVSALPIAGCAPCRVTGKMPDGSTVTLMSPTIVPWIFAKKSGSLRLTVKGLVQNKGGGQFWVIVQSTKP